MFIKFKYVVNAKLFQTPIAFLFSILVCSLTFSSNMSSLHLTHTTFKIYVWHLAQIWVFYILTSSCNL